MSTPEPDAADDDHFPGKKQVTQVLARLPALTGRRFYLKHAFLLVGVSTYTSFLAEFLQRGRPGPFLLTAHGSVRIC